MALRFTSLTVNDFISIESAKLDLKSGVYLVKGINKDKTEFDDTSNGSGKTTLFAAIYQGLFNKNSKDPKATVESVNNLYTGRPYNIVVEFDKDSDSYKVVNDRNKNKIVIFKNGEDISPKGITNQLTLIKNIIGFDFQTFSSLTFLNSESLNSIIDLTNKENIVYQFFDIESLKTLEKRIKSRRKEAESTRISIVSKLSVLEKQVKLLTTEDTTDIDALRVRIKELETIKDSILLKKNSKKLKTLESSIAKLDKDCAVLSKSLDAIKADGVKARKELDSLKSGVCPTCGQGYTGDITKHEEKVESLRAEYVKRHEEYTKLKEKLDELTKVHTEEVSEIEEELRGVEKQLNDLNLNVIIAEDREKQRKQLADSAKELEDEMQELKDELPSIESELKVYDGLLAVFKSGAVVNEYLRKYRVLLVKNFKVLHKYTDFAIDIKIRVNKGKMTYTFIDEGVEKPFTMLSAGERTRVSLMLLLATLKTIEQLTNTTINYLVLDELLGVLDSEGINFLKNVLSEMRGDKSIFIITHHGEIPDEFADGIITVTKESNISKVSYV
jgi:DNA repair exonuclease SbcCD ATPase subunit